MNGASGSSVPRFDRSHSPPCSDPERQKGVTSDPEKLNGSDGRLCPCGRARRANQQPRDVVAAHLGVCKATSVPPHTSPSCGLIFNEIAFSTPTCVKKSTAAAHQRG